MIAKYLKLTAANLASRTGLTRPAPRGHPYFCLRTKPAALPGGVANKEVFAGSGAFTCLGFFFSRLPRK